MKNVTLYGAMAPDLDGAWITCKGEHAFHAAPEWPLDRTALCGKNLSNGFERYASPGVRYQFCAKCLEELKQEKDDDTQS